MKSVLGVDIGGVIIDRVNDNTDTAFFGNNYLKTTAVPDVFEVLTRLARGPFLGNLHLVSKCGQKVQDKSMHWLRHHRFFELTGMPETSVHFCRERHEKAPICRDLGITHFVDDRLEVLGHLIDIVPNLFLFRPQEKEKQKFQHWWYRVEEFDQWIQIEAALLSQIKKGVPSCQ